MSTTFRTVPEPETEPKCVTANEQYDLDLKREIRVEAYKAWQEDIAYYSSELKVALRDMKASQESIDVFSTGKFPWAL
jgi:hypothetical protein